ncbi:hypothetical protein [Candidatus Poriferisocius sp.]|uniref:hypothetical protein n=1 Tax=Candidatus Poriferisocius sp. TaxID=3101276 RepID=UPI003B5C9A9A
MRKSVGMSVLVASLVIGATGCLNATLDLVVNEDGSGSYEVGLEVTQEFLDTLGAFGGMGQEPGGDEDSLSLDCEELLGEFDLDAAGDSDGSDAPPEGVEVESTLIDDGGRCGATVRVAWSKESADVAFEQMSAGEDILIRRVGPDGWSLVLPMDDISDDALGSGAADELAGAFTSLFDVSLMVNATLPGGPLDHNADRVRTACDATTFFWDVNLLDPPDALVAQTDGHGDCGGGWGLGQTVAVAILGLLAAALSAAGIILYRRKRMLGVVSD